MSAADTAPAGLRFGLNWTPSGDWFHEWQRLDPARTARDMRAIAGLGADHVRILPLWPLIQPNRTLIRRAALDDVRRVVDLAGEAGLDVNVDGLQGHLSSFDFVPAWLTSWHRRGLFTDPAVVDGTAAYLEALAGAVADAPNLMGVTVGNEVNQFAHAPHPEPYPVDAAGADRWLATTTAALRRGLDGSRRPLVTVAQYDAAWYDDAQPFGPQHAADHGDATVVHSWVFNGAAAVAGPLAPPSVRHAEYLLQLAAAWSPSADRPVWLQEAGAPADVVPLSDVPAFIDAAVRAAVRVPGLLGVTWWCSHDVSRRLADFPELEYDLGLLDADGRVKPAGGAFAALADELRGAPAAAPAPDALLVDDRSDGFRASCAPGGPVMTAWLALAEEAGGSPGVVLASRSDDAALLADRGLRRLHPVPAVLERAAVPA